ncbi:MAG TPA: sigma factor, partial [Gammaproteobacteria bacterium]|nr:sigma factor [Gammaproteobacteria bacterium]
MAADANANRNEAQRPSDAELLARGARGDGAAFGVLVRRHLRAATSLGLELLGNLDDAEDVVQDAFLVALDRANAFDPAREFTPWLHGIVRHKCTRLRARAARRRRLLALFAWRDRVEPAGETYDATATFARARALVDALPE